jgi:UDP-glucuronate 4-epimerase
MKVLITGAAGFIGFHAVRRLLGQVDNIVGIDNINDYYSIELKHSRLRELGVNINDIGWNTFTNSNLDKSFRFMKMDLSDRENLFNLFESEKFDIVLNLAAQAGVRNSITNPDTYIQSNVVGFYHILEACRAFNIKHLIHASSSSVYGLNSTIPFSEKDNTDQPISLYAASKKSNELMAHAYSHLYNFPVTCLRFFTVYGPWGRPDMAPMLFTDAISKKKTIKVFNEGNMSRDFTYIDDIVEGIARIVLLKNRATPSFKILNIGNGSPVNLMDFIKILEKELNEVGEKIYLPMQIGDVPRTWANIEQLNNVLYYKPQINIEEGVKRFVSWYKLYMK